MIRSNPRKQFFADVETTGKLRLPFRHLSDFHKIPDRNDRDQGLKVRAPHNEAIAQVLIEDGSTYLPPTN